MIFILAAIIFTTSLIVSFKLFPKYKVNTFHAIVVNYFTASLTSYFLAENKIPISPSAPWFKFSFAIGLLFILTFMAMSTTAQKISVIKSIIASKMSLIIPLGYAVLFVGEEPTVMKFIAIVLAMVGVLLTVMQPSKKERSDGGLTSFLLLALVFIGSGLVDTSFKYIEMNYFTIIPPQFIMMVCYGSAGVFGLLFFIVKSTYTSPIIHKQSIFAGVILGVLNYFSFIFVLHALHTPSLPSLVVFPLVNVGVLLLSTLVAILYFHEHLRRINYIGVVISILSILLLALQSYVI